MVYLLLPEFPAVPVQVLVLILFLLLLFVLVLDPRPHPDVADPEALLEEGDEVVQSGGLTALEAPNEHGALLAF